MMKATVSPREDVEGECVCVGTLLRSVEGTAMRIAQRDR